jgi:hypothetical protein
MFQWTSGSSTQPFFVGFVANDVTNVKIDGVVAPVSANDFFLTPLPDGFLTPLPDENPPLNVTITLSDGPSITETFLPAPPPTDGASHS